MEPEIIKTDKEYVSVNLSHSVLPINIPEVKLETSTKIEDIKVKLS